MLSYVVSLTLLTCAVILVRGIFRSKMSSRLVYALWLAVLIRMVLPFDLISIERAGVDYLGAMESVAEHQIVLMSDDKTENSNLQAETELEVNSPVENKTPVSDKEPILNSGNVGGSENVEQNIDSIQSENNFISDVITDKVETGIGSVIDSSSFVESQEINKDPVDADSAEKPSYETPSATQNEDLEKPLTETPTQNIPNETNEHITISVKDILNAVWLVGAVITASIFTLSWAVFSVKLVRNRELLTKSGKVKVYVTDRVASPCVCGLIPRIYVTPEARDSEDLSTVILHEKVHISHGDNIWNFLRIAAVSVFWYNPIVWAAAILSRRDAEFACDETVSLKLEDKSRLDYARMIVDMTPAKKNCVVGFAGGPIKERVIRLTSKHKNKIIVAAIAVLLVAVCIVTAFIGTHGKTNENDNEKGQTELTVSPAEDFEYTESTRHGIVITAYKGDDTTVVIPDKIDGETVSEIGKGAFAKNVTITKVVIPDSVIVIDESAFELCSKLEEVTLSEELIRLGKSAFAHCIALKEIAIPAKIGTWEGNTFELSGLEKVSFADGVGKIGNFAFKRTKLTEIKLPRSVVTIGEGAFIDCKDLAKITLSEKLETIEAYAFAGSDVLKEVSLPKNVDHISYLVFDRCPALEKLTFLGDAPSYAVWPDLGNIEAWSDINYTVYYRKGAKGFTTPTWKGCPAAVIGDEPKALEISAFLSDLLDMPYYAANEKYGSVADYSLEQGGTRMNCAFEGQTGVRFVYPTNSDGEVDAYAVPCEIVINNKYKERICGLLVGQMLEDATVEFDWMDVGPSYDPLGRYAAAAVGEFTLTVWMDYGIELDYVGYWEVWASEFAENPKGEIKSIRIGKLDPSFCRELRITEAAAEYVAEHKNERPDHTFDVSTWEYNFSVVLTAKRDIENLKINRLVWNEEFLVEKEELIEDIGDVKLGETVVITTDSVEIIGYVGISYEVYGTTKRYYPATSGMDGSAILVEIGGNLLSADMLYPGARQYEVTVSDEVTLADALFSIDKDEDGDGLRDFFFKEEDKMVIVKGLSVPVYLEFGTRWKLKSLSAYGYISEAEVGSNPRDYLLTDYEGAIIFNYNTPKKDETWVFTVGEVKEFISEDKISTVFNVVDSSLEYTRYAVKFRQSVTKAKTAPLDLATSRDDFFSETGKAKIENGKLVLCEPDISQTIGEVYDLDSIYEEYKLNFIGYESADDVIARNARRDEGKELPSTEQTIMPNQNHVGFWGLLDYVGIYKVTEDTVKIHGYLYRMLNMPATATLQNGEWIFVEDLDKYHEDDKPAKGKLVFTEDSVTIIYEDFGTHGERDESLNGWNRSYTFTDRIVNPYENGREMYRRIETCGWNYSGGILGHYKATFAQYDGEYNAYPYLEICNGGCECIEEGSTNLILTAEYGIEDGWMYPVKVFGRKMEEGVTPESDPMRYNYLKRFSHYVFDVGNGMHLKITIEVSNYNYDAYDNEQEVLDSIAKNCYIEYTLIDGKTGERIAFEREEITPSAEHLELAKTDVRYKWVVSFIGKDIEGCADVLSLDWGSASKETFVKSMAPLKDICFSSYSVVDDGDDSYGYGNIEFEFEISQSSYALYPPGKYVAVLSKGGMLEFSMYYTESPRVVEQEDLDEYADELEFAAHFFIWCTNVEFPDAPYGDNEGWRMMTESLFFIYSQTYGIDYTDMKLTKDDLVEIACELYGIEKYDLHEDAFWEMDGYCRVSAHGGLGISYDVIKITDEDEKLSFDVRYYSDSAEFGDGGVIRYSFERTNSDYGLRLLGIEKTVDTGLPIFYFAV